MHAGVGEDLDGGRGNEAGTEEEGGLGHCCCGGVVLGGWYDD
jgi:hypothetical protein